MKNLENIKLIQFEYDGIPTVAIFDITSISEADVKAFIFNQYPIGYDPRILFTSKSQWDTVFG